MDIILITIGVLAVVMLAMAVGVILKGKCLSGSCGGPKVAGADGKMVCGSCGRHGKPPEANESEQVGVS